MQKKRYWIVFLLFLATALLCPSVFAGKAYGEPADLPPLAGSPDVVVVPSDRYPGQYVYMVPGMTGVYFHNGLWYRNYRSSWFYSSSYGCSCAWEPIAIAFIPPIILGIPVDYALYLPANYYRIHYWEFHRNWRTWGRGQYWHKHAWFKHGMGPSAMRDRNAFVKKPPRHTIGKAANMDRRGGRNIMTSKGIGKKPATMAKQGSSGYSRSSKSFAKSVARSAQKTGGSTSRKSTGNQPRERSGQRPMR